MKTEKFDVVIVGAGPAGLRCAEILGNSKFNVLVLEKNSVVGPKICAGGLPERAVKLLGFPKKLLDFRYNKINFYINDKYFEMRYSEKFVSTMDRKTLGQWQLKKIKKFKNIRIRTGSKVSKIAKNYVMVNGKKIFYNFLVGADGSCSLVRRFLGIKPENMEIAIQYIIPTSKYKDLEFFFEPRLFSAWYAWIFPHKDYVSVGCGCNPKFLSSDKLMKNFKFWLKKKKIDISNAKYESFPINSDYQGYKFDNVFLAGDAGGFASGITGGGIYPALVSGEEVAKIILNPDHYSEEIEALLKIKEKHNRFLDFLIKHQNLRSVFFNFGFRFLKFPWFRRKAINLFA